MARVSTYMGGKQTGCEVDERESESLNERHSTVRARAGVCKVTDSVGESDGRVLCKLSERPRTNWKRD